MENEEQLALLKAGVFLFKSVGCCKKCCNQDKTGRNGFTIDVFYKIAFMRDVAQLAQNKVW